MAAGRCVGLLPSLLDHDLVTGPLTLDGLVLADGVSEWLVAVVTRVFVIADDLAVGVDHHVRLLLDDKALVVRLPFRDNLILVGDSVSLLRPAVYCDLGAALLLRVLAALDYQLWGHLI